MHVATRAGRALLAACLAAAVAGCGASSSSGSPSAPTARPPGSPGSLPATSAVTPRSVTGTVRLYTSVQQPTVDAVAAALAAMHPGLSLETFRAPTGEVAARIAAEEREGQIRADVLWLSDPLSVQGYASRDLLRVWQPTGAASLDPAWIAETYWGTRVLNVVMVRGADVSPGPLTWTELADPAYRDAVALPNPAVAGSAFGALGYFALSPDYGMDFYRSLKANGAVTVNAPDEVTAGVAEGRFKAGMTLDFSVRQAVDKGSPVALAWPDDGSIAMFGPIAVVASTADATAAEAFVEFALSEAGQEAIAGTGWEPVRPGVGGPAPEGDQVRPDWEEAYGRQQELLDEYAAIFGGG